MSPLQIISQFLTYKFPWWGICQLKFDPNYNTLYMRCVNPDTRKAIFKEASALSNLDIGIARFIVVYPGYPDIIIPYAHSQ
jgi:hypothetical protein